MWNFFRSDASCPVPDEQRDWLEGGFKWLTQTFRKNLKDRPVILPTPEFFPDDFHGTEADLWTLLGRVCGYMDVDPSVFRLYLYEEGNRGAIQLVDERGLVSGTAGLYHKDDSSEYRIPSIGIEVSQLNDPPALVATLAHEVGHELLLGGGKISEENENHEPLTDLLTVYCGLGIINANATVREYIWRMGHISASGVGRQGYLDQRMFGYALALFAHAREEEHPAWVKHVRPDVRVHLKQGLRFLAEE
jgi:hypothetical protein